MLKDIIDNLNFINIEVGKQVEDAYKYLKDPSQKFLEKIQSRDDYIDNLKSNIEDKSFSKWTKTSRSKDSYNKVRAVNIIAHNLERIADYSVNITTQAQHLGNTVMLAEYDYKEFFYEIIGSLKNIPSAFVDKNMQLALKICKSEFLTDKMYSENFKKIISDLYQHNDIKTRITILFIFYYLERMGDSLLNIGEAIIFSILGQKLKIYQYEALEKTLAQSNMQTPDINNIDFKSIWGTKSGCRIGLVRSKNRESGSIDVIFKEGRSNKIINEKRNIERWNNLISGIAPKVFSFQSRGSNSSMIIEFFNGSTFKDHLYHSKNVVIKRAISHIKKLLDKIWTSTMTNKPAKPGYFDQLSNRLDDIYKVHPNFKTKDKSVGSFETPAFEKLLENAKDIEKKTHCDFSVFIHGDFNIDNIFYKDSSKKIHFIDLHRSTHSDYVQDISVFIISNFREPVSTAIINKRINLINESIIKFCKNFAKKHNDDTFDIRLAMGVCRSLITSTRFVFENTLTKDMFLRGIYLLEQINNSKSKDPKEFKFPLDSILRY